MRTWTQAEFRAGQLEAVRLPVLAPPRSVRSHPSTQKEPEGVSALKLFGERNTGTNYLSELLRRNLRVRQLAGTVPRWWTFWSPESEKLRDLYFQLTFRRNLGWKHAVAPDRRTLEALEVERRRIGIVTLTKNPYSWLLSLYRRPYHGGPVPPTLLEFVTTPWKNLGRDRGPSEFHSPVAMWNQKNAAYLPLGPRVANLRYEDVLMDARGVVTEVAARFGLARKGRFQNVDILPKEGGPRIFRECQEYYLQEHWRDRLDPASVAAINAQLDPDLMRRFSYDWVEA